MSRLLRWVERWETRIAEWSERAKHDPVARRLATSIPLVLGLAAVITIWVLPLPHAGGWLLMVLLFTANGVLQVMNRGRVLQGGGARPEDKPVFLFFTVAGYLASVLMIFVAAMHAWKARNWALVGLCLAAVTFLTLLLTAKIGLEIRSDASLR